MNLTGRGLLWTLVILALVFPVVTVWLWPRLASRRVRDVSARVGLVLGAQLVAVLLMGVAVNDYGYLYGSWSEVWRSVAQPLNGGYRVTPLAVPAGNGPATSPGVTRVRWVGPYAQTSRWVKRGRLEVVHLNGADSQLGEDAFVYLPPEYFSARNRHTDFPAVEVFSGYPSTNRMLTRRLAFQTQLLHQVRQHRARPMVLVMLRPIVNYPRDTECTNVPGGPQAETFYAQDLTHAISNAYRVQPTDWGVMGVSTGGYCATKLLMDYPAIFRAGVSLSGYYHALEDTTTGNLWGGSAVLRDLNDPEWRLQHGPAPAVSLLVTSSRDEISPLGYSDTKKFLGLVRAPMRVSTIITTHGSHVFTTWKPQLPFAFRWMSARITKSTGSRSAVEPGLSIQAAGSVAAGIMGSPARSSKRAIRR